MPYLLHPPKFSEDQILSMRLTLQLICRDPDITDKETEIFWTIMQKLLLAQVTDDKTPKKYRPTTQRNYESG